MSEKDTAFLYGHPLGFEVSANTPAKIYYASEKGRRYFQVKEEWIDRENGGFFIPPNTPEFELLRKKGRFVLTF